MTDREAFKAARAAGLRKRHEQRLARHVPVDGDCECSICRDLPPLRLARALRHQGDQPVTTHNVLASHLPYTGTDLDPVKALQYTLAFSSRDWGEERDLAWLWGIILGWDDDDDPESDAMADCAARFGWSTAQVARLEALHERFVALAARAAVDQ